ncbi:Retrovirus-related Pol poly from transposon, partial [Paramuricea clavata]
MDEIQSVGTSTFVTTSNFTSRSSSSLIGFLRAIGTFRTGVLVGGISLLTSRCSFSSNRPSPVNTSLYPLKTSDIADLLPNLAKSKVFSVVDAKNGFWHVQLDQESSYLTTFATPWGRYRWKQMPFGISPAPEEFQRYLDLALEGLEGIKAICDDILVCGVGESYEEAVQDHDNKLVSLLERCRSNGIKLNSKKLLFRRNQVSFMGHLITSKGLKPDPAKVEAIQKMPIQTSKR